MSDLMNNITGDESSKHYLDIEYSTHFDKEVAFLRACRIYYTFVKTIDGTPVYKYQKTKELFEALAVFYRDK